MRKFIANRDKNRKIGKVIGENVYVHKSAIDALDNELVNLVDSKLKYIKDNFDIIKINKKTGDVSFLQSPDWDTLDEPHITKSILVSSQNKVTTRSFSGVIYHHKWMFVKDDYVGFDVEESKCRSEYWMNHPYVLELKNNKSEKFSSKIGRDEYWKAKVLNIIF